MARGAVLTVVEVAAAFVIGLLVAAALSGLVMVLSGRDSRMRGVRR
jgi:hypothetical protein